MKLAVLHFDTIFELGSNNNITIADSTECHTLAWSRTWQNDRLLNNLIMYLSVRKHVIRTVKLLVWNPHFTDNNRTLNISVFRLFGKPLLAFVSSTTMYAIDLARCLDKLVIFLQQISLLDDTISHFSPKKISMTIRKALVLMLCLKCYRRSERKYMDAEGYKGVELPVLPLRTWNYSFWSFEWCQDLDWIEQTLGE